ncbi:hypothetical protein [Streptomyces sp. NBC_01320]|uniref:hypothetical protein n=1 Tax=Streptomyces sp. NBC_01320 TaxID=2903824 RepID=UPI002E0F7875
MHGARGALSSPRVLGGEDGIEGVGVLAVAVAQQEPWAGAPLAEAPVHNISRRLAPILGFLPFVLCPLRFLACLSQRLLGLGRLLTGLVVPVACLLQRCVSVCLFSARPAKTLIGHRGVLAGLGVPFLPLAAPLGKFALRPRPRRPRRSRR